MNLDIVGGRGDSTADTATSTSACCTAAAAAAAAATTAATGTTARAGRNRPLGAM